MKHTDFYGWVSGAVLVSCVSFFPAVSAWAVNTANLYRITVPVASQLEDQRDLAESDGFLQVLIRLTSDPDIAKNPVIRNSLHRAEYYVRDFSYSPPSAASSEYEMQINYDPIDVAHLLTKASVPFWADKRPLTIAWLSVTDKNNQTEMIGSDSTNHLYDMVKQQSKRLGVAMILPVMDVGEMNAVSPELISQMALPELRQASKRYSPDAMLIAQIKDDGAEVVGKWSLIMNANQWNWTTTGKTSDAVISAAMTQISQTMVRQYTYQDDKKESWLNVTVTDVNGNEELGQLMQYMQRLAPVEKVQLSQVTGDTVGLYLLIGGTIDGFQKNAAVGKRLTLKLSDAAAKKLTYQWVR